MEQRYKIYTDIEGEKLVFKRYGADEGAVRREFNMFMKESMPQWSYGIDRIEKDKTHLAG